jgi:hypothetical protein
VVRRDANTYAIEARGWPSAPHVLEYSTDLIRWFRFSDQTMYGAGLKVIDTVDPKVTRRFYRAVPAP